MFRTLTDFYAAWKYERSATEKIFSKLTNDVLQLKTSDHVRTLGRLSGHIVEALREMPSRAGLGIEYREEILRYDNVEDLRSQYSAACDMLEAKLKERWTDKTLDTTIDMYGQQWKCGEVLSSLIAHQAHHRAQMTVLMRLVVLKVPGIYGPSNEEWANFGMPAMK